MLYPRSLAILAPTSLLSQATNPQYTTIGVFLSLGKSFAKASFYALVASFNPVAGNSALTALGICPFLKLEAGIVSIITISFLLSIHDFNSSVLTIS